MSLKQLFLSGKERRTWEGDKGGARSTGMLGTCLRERAVADGVSTNGTGVGGEKKAINTECSPHSWCCALMNSLKPLRKTSKQAVMIEGANYSRTWAGGAGRRWQMLLTQVFEGLGWGDFPQEMSLLASEEWVRENKWKSPATFLVKGGKYREALRREKPGPGNSKKLIMAGVEHETPHEEGWAWLQKSAGATLWHTKSYLRVWNLSGKEGRAVTVL